MSLLYLRTSLWGKIADKMVDKTFNKNKIKETTDANLNDLEINDNSAKDNLIIITRIVSNNINLENNDKFNAPLEILVSDNKEIQTKLTVNT